jgi:hypothetical protein
VNTDEYAKACGPSALAALMRCSPLPIAHVLLGIQKARGKVIAPMTPTNHMELFLIRRGYSVEPWRTFVDDCRPWCTAAEHAERMRRPPPMPIREAIVSLAETPDEEKRLRRTAIKTMTSTAKRARFRVNSWRAMHDGDWLLFVREHVLAIRDGIVIAGGDDYEESPLVRADRIFKPEN